MAQFKTGAVKVTNNSTTVVGVGVDWSQISPNNFFVVASTTQLYIINDVNFDPLGNGGAGEWSLILAVPYQGATDVSGTLGYTIHKDFTPFLNMPTINAGDVETATILTRALTLLDQYLANLGGGGGGGGNGDFVINTAPQGWDVGTLLTFVGGAYVAAASNLAVNANVLGAVVAKNGAGTQFTVRPAGLITGFTTTLTQNSIYYLHNTTGVVNYTTNLANTTLKVPVFLAISTTAAILLVAGSSTGGSPFTAPTGVAAGAEGIVPAPPINGMLKVLTASGWADNLPAVGIIDYQRLKVSGSFATADWAAIPATAPVALMLQNLNSRIATGIVSPSGSDEYPYFAEIVAAQNFVLPVGVTKFRIRCWGAGGAGSSGSTGQNRAGCGGGAGAYSSRKFLPAVLGVGNYSLYCYPGVGGVGAGQTSPGGNGENSYVAVGNRVTMSAPIIRANGGAGAPITSNATNLGGAGATDGLPSSTNTSTGDVFIPGENGSGRDTLFGNGTTTAYPGQGGKSPVGYEGGAVVGFPVNGNSFGVLFNPKYCAGGSGGQYGTPGSIESITIGGNGAPGRIVIEWSVT